MSSTNIYAFKNQKDFDSFNQSMATIFGLDYIQEQFNKEDHMMKVDKISLPWNTGKVLDQEFRDMASKRQKGKKHSEESKRKLSESLKGRKKSEETKRKMSESAKNMSEEHRLKLSNKRKGIVFSEETKRKMSEAATLRHKLKSIR